MACCPRDQLHSFSPWFYADYSLFCVVVFIVCCCFVWVFRWFSVFASVLFVFSFGYLLLTVYNVKQNLNK